MANPVSSIDRLASRSRPVWIWLGQVGLVVLGVHLVADRLDDYVHDWLIASPIPFGEGQSASWVAAWIAVSLELVVAIRAAGMVFLSHTRPPLSFGAYRRGLSVNAVVNPLFWFATAAAGSWQVGMAAEDLVADWLGPNAFYVGLVVALLGPDIDYLVLVEQAISPCSGFEREKPVVILVQEFFYQRVALCGYQVFSHKHAPGDGFIVYQQNLDGDADLRDFVHIKQPD